MESGPPDEIYTVGWICALQTELDAAINMLDKGYKKRFGDGNDKNVYVPGRIGSHYVVITALPMGWMGNNTAAMVATRMMIKFQNIQVGLLVGIGGGFPNKEADIRLGDVVVSKPDGRFNGVVQYDLGKYTKDSFQRMGAMNAPPERILAVLQFMPPHGTFLGKQPMSPYPGESFDQLYDRDDDRGQEELVVRECGNRQNGPCVFYGTIASGNGVVKDARKRKTLIQEHNVLCCEMEAAGLMNSPFPCLVIRGISDYADGHKSDRWQDYAASAAAQYARDFLHELPEDNGRLRRPLQGTNQTNFWSVF
jgi:nucleoside phosphorylase